LLADAPRSHSSRKQSTRAPPEILPEKNNLHPKKPGGKNKSVNNQKKKLRFGRPTNEAMESKASKTGELQILAIRDFLFRDGHGRLGVGGGRRGGNGDAEEKEKQGDGGGG